jgi:hypothetical protein
MPFEAILAAAKKAGCESITMWGGRGGWDEHNPALDHDAEMPCYVVYGQDTEKWEWMWPEQYVISRFELMAGILGADERISNCPVG